MRELHGLRCALLSVLVTGIASAAPDGPTRSGHAPLAEVVGGEPAAPNKWRDAAGIHLDGDFIPDCSGVLVAPNLVVTARHCLDGEIVTGVLLGATQLDGSSGETFDATATYVHPTLDVGVIVLARDASITPRVIASSCVISQHLENGAAVAIVGFGLIDANGTMLTDVLREAQTTVVDYDCSFQVGCDQPGKQLSAGGSGIDSCLGDSGGPLYLLTEHYDYLVATTWSGIPGQTTPCGEGGLYVRSDAIIEWLEDTTGVAIPRANCNTPPRVEEVTIRATPGDVGKARLRVEDDEGGSYTYAVQSSPQHGEAGVTEDGVAFYRSTSSEEVVDDSFEVLVTDEGVPALSSVVTVEVREDDGGCGCRSLDRGRGGGVAVVSFVLLFFVLGRRASTRPDAGS